MKPVRWRFKALRTSLLFLLTSVEVAACAHITFESVDTWNKPWYQRWFTKDDGIHYYRPKPYLLITETKTEKPGSTAAAPTTTTKSCVAEIKYLPDYTQEYVMVPHYWLGSVAMKPALTDGWNLTNFDSTVDTKIPETINAFASLAKSIAPSGIMSSASTNKKALAVAGTPLHPGLYQIVPSGYGVGVGPEVFTAPAEVCDTLTALPLQPKPSGTPAP
jgi:hypothetical protein